MIEAIYPVNKEQGIEDKILAKHGLVFNEVIDQAQVAAEEIFRLKEPLIPKSDE